MRKLLSALLLTAMLLLSGCLDVSDGQNTQKFDGLDYNPPITAPDFTLTNQYNTTTSVSEHAGKVVIVAFTYTHCPDVCLAVEANLYSVMTELGPDYGTDVEIISITIDPMRDTPEHLLNWTTARGYVWPHVTSEDHMVMMDLWYEWGIAVDNEHSNSNHSDQGENENEENETSEEEHHEEGEREDEGQEGEAAEIYEVGHSTVTFIIDQGGMKRIAWVGSDWSVHGFLEDIYTLMGEDGHLTHGY